MARASCCQVQTPKTPEQSPRVKDSSTFQWQWLVEAAGVGAWGRTFQVWVYGFSWGTCGGASGVSISPASMARRLVMPFLSLPD